MVNRGLLRRQRVGRKMYWGLTDRGTRIVQDGRERALKTGAVNYDWDGTWTLLAFSLPDSWQRQRHDLRSQLAWVGFGPLQGGLWIAPGAAEVDQIVAGLGLEAHVRVFRARTHELTDIGQLVRDAYDLRGLASRYEDFLKRWDHSELPARAPDPLVAQLTLIADWLQVIRRDPHLPVEHLPADWPAVHAQATFMRLRNALLEPAAALAQQVLDTIPVDTESLDEEPASA
jgi:phenylacetic acid degradation operon negative regulatory protein